MSKYQYGIIAPNSHKFIAQIRYRDGVSNTIDLGPSSFIEAKKWANMYKDRVEGISVTLCGSNDYVETFS